MPVQNAEIAQLLEEMADLLEIEREKPFHIRGSLRALKELLSR